MTGIYCEHTIIVFDDMDLIYFLMVVFSLFQGTESFTKDYYVIGHRAIGGPQLLF